MVFETKLEPNAAELRCTLGMAGDAPLPPGLLRRAAQAARPRWTHLRLPLARPAGGLSAGPLALPGQDIAAHLAGCEACELLALTLGEGMEQAIRAAEATDMAAAVVLDAAASVLAEQYAGLAQQRLAGEAAAEGLYLTSRFSPGYGDLPLELQGDFVRLLDAHRAIGLAATEHSLLTPRKSITAILGLARHPVSGALAGCARCALKEGCTYRKEGRSCGKNTV